MIDDYEPTDSLLDGDFSSETTEDWDMSEIGKMKPTEYTKMCEWCRTNGFKEIEKDKECIDGDKYFVGLYDYSKRYGRLYIRISSLSQASVNLHTKFIYVQANIQWINKLPTGLWDFIDVHKNISTTKELELFVSRVCLLNRLSNEFELYQQ